MILVMNLSPKRNTTISGVVKAASKASQEFTYFIGMRHKFSWDNGLIVSQMRRTYQDSIRAQLKLLRLIRTVLGFKSSN